ncbi:U5 small nuclear ribonucleoprotein 40 kDa protein-like [Daphnia pulex]|uniref:U5 small nuclear ribonucleoprotein 40 kDa protein-like n=1 Tax=Daphnia pulex TaxID=6669 RepID=UPI001EDE7834|nr:U5 small nuclear ribonucleoprotein 40 kDa protein-like [Daphnia pulex]
MTKQKPYKLVSQDGRTKKGITAGSLDELTGRARQLFSFGSEVPITVFEEDGTEITSNEYLLFLEKFTVLVIVPEIGTCSRLRNATNNNPESINKSFTNEHKLPGSEDQHDIHEELTMSEDVPSSTEHEQEKVQFVEVQRSIALMSEVDYCVSRFHPTLPVLVCGFNRVFLLNAEDVSVPFSEWTEKEISFDGQGLKIITTLEWNFDGSQLAAGCKDNTVIVWSSFPTGDVLLNTNCDFKWVYRIAWNPVKPNIFATLDKGSKKVLFWNSTTHDGKSNVFYTIEHEKRISQVEWTSKNQIAIGFMNGLLEIWEIDENESKFQVLQIIKRITGAIKGLEWSNVTKYLASSSSGKEGWITIWSLSSSKSNTSKIPDYFQKFEHGFSSLAWLPARNTVNGGINSAREMPENFAIACGCTDGSIWIWNPLERDKTKILRGPSRSVTCLSFSPDGRYLASASRYNITIWLSETWKPVFSTTPKLIASPHHDCKISLSWMCINGSSAESSENSTYKLTFSSRNDKIVVWEVAAEVAEVGDSC